MGSRLGSSAARLVPKLGLAPQPPPLLQRSRRPRMRGHFPFLVVQPSGMDGSLAAMRSPASVAEDAPNGDYLDRLMRRECFEALWPLFAKASRPAKELTESYSALVHLRPFMSEAGPHRVIHVGDGAHAR